MGARGVRVNGISAGPIKTLAASGIKDLGKLLSQFAASAPIRRNVTIDDVGNAAAFLAAAAPGTFIDSKGRASITLPASATVSFTHRVNDQWKIMADVSRTAWSKFDQMAVQYDSNQPDSVLPFHYRDTTFASIGTDFRVNDKLTLRGGLAYDQTPTTDAHRDVRVPDTTRKWLSLGLTYAASDKMEYSVGYTHLFTKDPNITSTSPTGNTVTGKYKVSGDVLAASMQYKF
ncbi:MAG: hypothetical protein DI592_10745 [Stenotrophomonas maltophilia]|nr:MAG: hypothetical protein DI592_10745 [Stenotrophomonas maltophilia]